jgi:hypothetical protein
MAGEGVSARTLRGRRSLRKLPDGLRTVRTVERRNTSWSYKRRGGCGEPIAPLRRAKRFERPVNPARVVLGMATSRGTVETSRNPWRGLDGLVCPNHPVGGRLKKLIDKHWPHAYERL